MAKESQVRPAPAGVKKTSGKYVPVAGPGRPKGIPNKITSDLRDMIREALESAGGANYLVEQATLNPTAFMSLVGRILPTKIEGTITVTIGEMVQAARAKAGLPHD
jgi:hypothetical protein